MNCTSLPISIIMLKIFVVHRKCKDGGVMVKSKIIIGTLDPFYLLRSELWQPAEIFEIIIIEKMWLRNVFHFCKKKIKNYFYG